MQENIYYVYILANKRNGTFYVGVTNNLTRRILEHKEKIIKGFTSKYGVDKLVYFEMHKYINNALQRESNIKAWKRKWKLELIESNNKNWNDLFYDLTTEDEIKDLKELIKKRRAWIPAFAGMTIFFVPTVSPEFLLCHQELPPDDGLLKSVMRKLMTAQ
jgi:putative endonuclease